MTEEIIKSIRESPGKDRGQNPRHSGVMAKENIEEQGQESETWQDEEISPDFGGFVIDIGDGTKKNGHKNRGNEEQ